MLMSNKTISWIATFTMVCMFFVLFGCEGTTVVRAQQTYETPVEGITFDDKAQEQPWQPCDQSDSEKKSIEDSLNFLADLQSQCNGELQDISYSWVLEGIFNAVTSSSNEISKVHSLCRYTITATATCITVK